MCAIISASSVISVPVFFNAQTDRLKVNRLKVNRLKVDRLKVDRLKVNRLKVEGKRFLGYFSLQPKYLFNHRDK